MDFDKWNENWYSQANEADRKMFREWLTGVIRNERVNVCFTKADGSERWLHCSLHPELLPEREQQAVSESTRKRSEEALSVWDLEAQAWRSFRFDRIKQFSFNLGELHV